MKKSTPGIPSGETLGEIFERNRALYYGKQALVFEGRSYTWGELTDRIFCLISAFYRRGLRRQDRVAILAQNSNCYIETQGACETAGYVSVGLNYRLAEAELGFVLKDSAPSILVFDSMYTDLIGKLRPGLDVQHYICITRDGFPKPDWAEDYEALITSESPQDPVIRADPEDLAYIMYTSGTTGLPKGAMLGQREQIGFTKANAITYGARTLDRILLVMPFYHIGAKTSLLTFALVGGTIVLHRNYDIAQIARSIAEEMVTTAHLAPIMLHDLMALPDLDSHDHSSLKRVIYASGPMPVAQLRHAISRYGQIFMQVYGMTEFVAVSCLAQEDHLIDGTEREQRWLSSAGKVSVGCRLRILRDDGSDCAANELGEVVIGGPYQLRGYWNKHQATHEVLRDGWFHTGDIGQLDEDGFLYILDRKKDMILSGGENIYSREVEEAIYSHPAVTEAAVIAVPDDRWGEAVMAYVATKPGAALTADAVIEHCRSLIASYKKPKYVEFLDALPRLANKKIDKKALRAPHWANKSRNVN